MNVNLHIERLILDGLPIESRHGSVLQAAVETELARLLTQSDLASNFRGGAVPSVRANAIQLASPSTPVQLARQIAGSIYGSIGKGL